jgi:predicted nucleotidyltransferase
MNRTHPGKREATREAIARWYGAAAVPMSVIRRYARRIVDRFQPAKIVLFGSYAYGTPHAGSDVDILVIMPARNELDQAWKIDRALDRNFSLHLIVRTPKNVEWRLREGDWFLREIIARGRTLYEKTDARVGRQGGRRLSGGTPARKRTRSVS